MPLTSLLVMMSYRQNIKDLKERNKRLQKTDWLNTPNVYKKEEIDEIGTDNPKKITKVSTLGYVVVAAGYFCTN